MTKKPLCISKNQFFSIIDYTIICPPSDHTTFV